MHKRSLQLAGSAFTCSLILAGMCLGQTTERVSVDSLGVQGNLWSFRPSISTDGRYVAYWSDATNLVPGDTNGEWDVFVHDRQTGVTERVSLDSLGVQGNNRSYYPSISADGRYVAFESRAFNLVAGDSNQAGDIFVHDRQAGVTERVSLDSFGAQGNGNSEDPSISADGRYVAFYSDADNLVTGDTNGAYDIFVHDRLTGVTQRVSVDSLGTQGNNGSWWSPSISADGRYVAFRSLATNLVLGDTNGEADTFVHDLQTGVTERVSVDSLGVQGNYQSENTSISADGRYVSFESAASNLVPGDTNGKTDVFFHDRQTGVTSLVSVDSLGVQGNGWVDNSSISADGRQVAFASIANNLWPGDSNERWDIFVHDLLTGVTELVSVNSIGRRTNDRSEYCSISGDGRHVAFASQAEILVLGDTNLSKDIFVHDRWNGLGANSIYLTGPSNSPVLSSVDFSWQTTRGNSRYWLASSQSVSGSVIDSHFFDLGYPMSVMTTGTHPANGVGSFTSPPVPSGAAGYTFFFEVAAQDAGGILYDSNVHGVTFY